MLSILLFSFIMHAEQVRVAILDTGIDPAVVHEFNVCPNGIKDFTNTSWEDTHGHGTNVAQIINKYNRNLNVCFMFLKVFSKDASITATVSAIVYAMDNGVKVINYSGGGDSPDELEREALNVFFKRHGILIAAAGNEHKDLDKKCTYFPACYKDVFVVSNDKAYSNKLNSSIKMSYDGEFGGRFHGSSQSTARATSEFLNYLMKHPLWK